MTTMTRPTHQVRPRKTTFDLAKTRPHWLADDPQSTQTANVAHLLLPTGERFFCDSVRLALPYITDEHLRRQVKGFIGQEVTHAGQHERCIEHMASYGIDVRRQMALAERARKALNRIVDALPEPFRRQVVIELVARTAAAEHVTAYMGDWLVSGNNWDDIDVDPDMKHLLRWHGAEEIEHRHVAFDVFQHLSGSYIRRVLPIAVVGPGLTVGWSILAAGLLWRDPTTNDRWSWRRHAAAARSHRMMSLPSLFWDLRVYLRPGHHPSKLPGSVEHARAYLANAPGVAPRHRPPRAAA